MFKRLFEKIIIVYRVFLSPWLGGQCRFYPTCSEYARQTLEKHRLGEGLFLSFKRILKCHPYHSGGVDLP